MKALGFDNEGIQRTLSVAQLIEDDPEAAWEALGGRPVVVSEDPFATVDTEAQFDAALEVGKSMVLRGEGSGGVIPLTTPKVINGRHTEIRSDSGAVLSVTLDLSLPQHLLRGITVHADDVTFRNFELTSTHPIASNPCYGLAFSEGDEDHGHRMRLLDMHIHNWQRCISKDGSPMTTPHNDVLIERLYAHTAREYVCLINFGLTRLVMRDSRLLGKIPGDTHVTTDNAMFGGSNWEDCVFENCIFADVGRIGFEATAANYSYYHRRTRLLGCRSENCGSMGFSQGFGEGGLYSHCKAKNVRQIGFEVAGRGPGFPGDPNHRYAQAVIDSCEVDGVHGDGIPAYGISVDGARDTHVRGATRVSNVTSSLVGGGAVGLSFAASERCSVRGAVFDNAGNCPIYVYPWYLPNTSGHHEIVGNSFRNAPGNDPAVYKSIIIENVSAVVQDNISWQGTGMLFGYTCTTTAPAKVWVDGVSVAPGAQTFGGTNRIIPVP